MIIVLASISVKPGEMSEFLDIFKSNVPDVLKENGCVEYTPTIDFNSGMPRQSLDENVMTVIEKWESLQALQTHLASPHMRQYQQKVKDMVSGVGLKILEEA